jgi:WD40 repeat protein
MHAARYGHTATLFTSGPDAGEVLVAGGTGSSGDRLGSAELYNPVTGDWSPVTNNMVFPRSGHTATLLTSGAYAGDVLVAGGEGGNGTFREAELYNPSTGYWTITGQMSAVRSGHAAVLLNSGPEAGDVLVAGGYDINGNPLDTAEVWDPTTNDWTAVDSMSGNSGGLTATQLSSGQTLVTGGADSTGPLANVEEYHTESCITLGRRVAGDGLRNGAASPSLLPPPAICYAWSSGTGMSTPRDGHTATLLASDQVLVVGGQYDIAGDLTNSAELFTP